MKNLLDLVQDYQTGGYVNPFDPSGQPTQEGIMSQYDIELTDDKYQPFLPTYDQTGEQFAIDNYILGREGLYSGAQDALSTAGVQEQQRQATSGFSGSGTNLLDTTRSDIVNQFGREGQRMFSGLQQDIYGQRRGFEDQLLSAIGELEGDAYTIGETDNGGGGNSLGDLPYQGDTITFQGNNAFWNPTLNKYEYGTLTLDDDGNTVENIYPDASDPQTPEGGVNINFIETSSGNFDPFSNIGQYVYIPDTDMRFEWDSSKGQYVQYTGG